MKTSENYIDVLYKSKQNDAPMFQDVKEIAVLIAHFFQRLIKPYPIKKKTQ